MKMAKADYNDFETAFLVFRILDAAERGNLMPVDDDDGDEWPELDPDSSKDLRKFFDLLMGAQEQNPSGLMRVIGCAHTLMDDSNAVVDPDKDYVDFHPRFAKMEEQLRRCAEVMQASDPGNYAAIFGEQQVVVV